MLPKTLQVLKCINIGFTGEKKIKGAKEYDA